MESALEWHSALALLDWQVDLGADEAIGDAPVDRFAVAKEAAEKAQARKAQAQGQAENHVVRRKEVDAVEVAREAASTAKSLDELQAAIADFDHCTLKRGARSLVFADGHASARVLILGEAVGLRFLVGAVLVLGGIALSLRRG